MRDHEASDQPRRYTTRLQKGGALLDSMRALTLAWDEHKGAAEQPAASTIALPSRHRVRDVVQRAFIPRLVKSRPPHLWRVAAALERAGADRSVVVPIHYYATAASEPVLRDFVIEDLFPRAGTAQEIRTEDVLRFLDRKPDEVFGVRRWAPTVRTRVARGLLAALRDYGVLTGGTKKRIGALYLPVQAFSLIARIRHELGYRGQSALHDDVWMLFFLDRTAVERFFAESTVEHLLRFEVAGPVVRIEFPDMTLEDYAGDIARRAPQAARV